MINTVNPYFTQGTSNEQLTIEDIIIESMKIYGHEVYYIPRTLMSKDEILGEDRLSKFENAFPIEMYFENIDNFEGGGFMIQKFGLMVEQSATLSVARRRWNQLVGRTNKTILPDRPCEGDLIYFPLSKGLFEIKFVQHQDPFYQLGKLYVYKLQVELFQYASERIETGLEEVDIFESLKTFSTDIADSAYGTVTSINVTNQGSGYTIPPTVSIISNPREGLGATAIAILGTGTTSNKVIRIDVTNGGTGYTAIPSIQIVGTGTLASGTAIVNVDIDKIDSYGDNNTLQDKASTIILATNNIFGDPL
jgi:hypothetical protein